MLKNYLKIAFRSIIKQKAYSIINILGLTIGITCSLLIFLFIYDELTYDHNHKNINQIYRVNAAYHLPNNGGFEQYAAGGPMVGEMILKDFPEVIQITRIHKLTNKILEKPNSNEKLYETVFAADSNLFKVFTFPFIAGNPETALQEPFALVLTERTALKLFNRTNVLGETIYFPDDSVNYRITGVIENNPSNTLTKFDLITSFETLKSLHYNFDSWWNYSFYTFLELGPQANVHALDDKIKFISRKYIANQEDGSGYRQEYSLQPLTNIHLESNLRSELEPNSRKSYVIIFGIIGVFILLIACINFMNLATARSAKRAKEIGVRKVSGAFRHQLIIQFMSESLLITCLAALLSFLLTLFCLPYLNNVTGKTLTILTATQPIMWLVIAVIIVLVACLAGSYPSLFLSAFKPTETLKGSFATSSKGNKLRKALVIFQFTISIILISGTIVVYQHLTFLRTLNLGFDKEKIVIVPTRSSKEALRDYSVVREELKRTPGIVGASVSYRVPGKEMGNNVVRIGWDDKATWSDMRFLTVDYDFASLYNIEILEGRSFDENFPSDVEEAFMLNESGMRRLGWINPKDAVGQKLRWQNRSGYVIGIVKDFHFMASNTAIEPFIITMNTNWSAGYLSIKISGEYPANGINTIRTKFESVLPNQIFEYFFLDEDYDKQYKAEDRFMNVFSFFAVVAILIACLGLYGLAMFTAELRFKEIGIRKVLGATTKSLVYLQIKGFLILVIIAFLISAPVSYWGMSKWLNEFPVHEKINPIIYLLSGVLSMLIAWITVSYQSFKASRINPVDSIMHD